MIALCQVTDSSKICLKPKQFDFYAQAVVDRKELRKDSVIFEKLLKSKDFIIEQKDNQLSGKDVEIAARDSIKAKYKVAYEAEKSGKTKAEKRVITFKNLSLILGSSTVILLCVLLILI